MSSSQSPLSSVSACGENCARSLAPPLPTARGAAGAPFGLAQKENAPRPVEEKKALVRAPVQWPSARDGVGVSVQAPILPGLRARLGLLRVCSCRPVPDDADGVGVVIAWNCVSFRCRSPGSSGKPGGQPVGAVISRPPSRGPGGHRCADQGGSSVIKNNLPALGTAGGGDIRRRNERAVLLAQMLCIPGQVRRSGFPGLRQPIDPIVALQSAALHFRAAERTIQTNLLLFRYPQERDSGKPRVFPVLSPAAKEDISIIFGRTCACRKFPDPGALGAVHQ